MQLINDATIAITNSLRPLPGRKPRRTAEAVRSDVRRQRLWEGLMPIRTSNLPVAEVLALIGDGVITTDEKGEILLANQSAEEIFGYKSRELIGRHIEELIPERFRANHATFVREFGSAAEPTHRAMARNRELFGRRKDGQEVPLEATLSRQHIGGQTILTVAVRDISQRRTLEIEAERRGRALERSEARLRLAFRAGNIGAWEWDVASDQVRWEGAEAALWGLSDKSVVPRSELLELVHPDDREKLDASAKEALGVGHWSQEFRVVHPGGRVRWLVGVGDVVKDQRANIRMIGINLDITDRIDRDEQRHLLMSEMRHRLQNLLATVNAVIHLSESFDGSVDEYRNSLIARVNAINETQKILMSSASDTALLSELLARELASYSNPEANNIVLSGPRVEIARADAVTLGLAFHELATNAAKYGALSATSGRVSVNWQVLDAEQNQVLRVHWEESGGPEVKTPGRRGFGTKLVEQTIKRMPGAYANIHYFPPGLQCTIGIPLYPPQSAGENAARPEPLSNETVYQFHFD